jgi:hypothetical protein
MRSIRNLEIHAAHACNLHCDNCSHYSNYGHKGILSPEEASGWMSRWDRRLAPRQFSVLGGEPTVNPKLTEILRVARTHWPTAHLRLVTNGFLLPRHPDLPAFLADDPDAQVYLSVHHDGPEYSEKVRPVFDLLRDWQDRLGIKVARYDALGRWERRYHGRGAGMEPFADGCPRSSWEICHSRYCPQLFDGMIWKCAALAYLPMQHAKFGLSEKWAPYLKYEPLTADCSEAELNEFFNREEEQYCGMCPAERHEFRLPNPLVPLGVSKVRPDG